MSKVTRRRVLQLGLLLLASFVAFVARPVWHLLRVPGREPDDRLPTPAGMLDDRSGMSATPVIDVVTVRDDIDLQEALARARRDKLPVALAGSRSSMGGQTLVPDGLVLDMTALDLVRYDEDTATVIAGAGATWAKVLEVLSPFRRSPAVAAPLADCTVGGALAVNAYGWQPGRPPTIAGVRSFRIMLADGVLWDCSRERNEELFRAAIGGYGQLGAITEVTLETVANAPCDCASETVGIAELADRFIALAGEPDVEMATARLSPLPESFLNEAALTVWRRSGESSDDFEAFPFPGLRRAGLRGSIADPYGKWLNRQLEASVLPLLMSGDESRNTLLNDPTMLVSGQAEFRSTLLLTLLVPPAELAALASQAALIIADEKLELIGASVHYVGRDEETVLRYARSEVCALQLTVEVLRRPSGEFRLREVSRPLIEAAIRAGGSWFMPYRRHASPDQFRRAYLDQFEFMHIKQRYDPDGRFQSSFFQTYGDIP